MSQSFTTESPGSTAGWIAAFVAFSNSLTATQDFVSNGITPLGTKELSLENQYATAWNNIMATQDEQAIQGVTTADSGNATQESADMQAATAKLSIHNSLLSQSNSFWNGLNQGTNQTGSDISGTLQLVYQMMTQGILTTLNTVVQIAAR